MDLHDLRNRENSYILPEPIKRKCDQLMHNLEQSRDLNAINYFIESWSELNMFKELESKIINALRKHPTEVVAQLNHYLHAKEMPLRLGSADIARYFPDQSLLPSLEKCTQDSSEEVIMAAIEALGNMDDPSVSDILERALFGLEDNDIRDSIWMAKHKRKAHRDPGLMGQ